MINHLKMENIENLINKTINESNYINAKKLVKEKKYEEAIKLFGEILESKEKMGENMDSLSVAPIYCEYGNVLMLNAETNADLFGDQIDQAKIALKEYVTNKDKHNEDTEDKEDKEDKEETEDKDPNDIIHDDFESAWEVLEISRVIYNRYIGKSNMVNKELAYIYMRLGDLGMESGMFMQAINDYKESFLLQEKYLIKDYINESTNALADLLCSMAMASVYQSSNLTTNSTNDQINNINKENQKMDQLSSKSNSNDAIEFKKDGLKYYFLAGKVIAEDIYRLANASKIGKMYILPFILNKIPGNSRIKCEKIVKKLFSLPFNDFKIQNIKMNLPFNGNTTTIKEDFIDYFNHMFNNKKEEKETVQQILESNKQLFEYLEIYTELQEKVDGVANSILEDTSKESTKLFDTKIKPFTTIGFEQSFELTEKVSQPITTVAPRKKKRSIENTEEPEPFTLDKRIKNN